MCIFHMGKGGGRGGVLVSRGIYSKYRRRQTEWMRSIKFFGGGGGSGCGGGWGMGMGGSVQWSEKKGYFLEKDGL